MKNSIIYFIIILVSFGYSSCSEEDITKLLPEYDVFVLEVINIPVHVNQTDGNWTTFTNTQSLSIENAQTSGILDKMKSVKINSLSYTIINFTGDPNGEVDASFSVDNVVSLNNAFTVKTSADNGTVYKITETAEFSKIANDLLNNYTISINYSGDALSNNNDMDFIVKVSMDVKITIDP